MTKGKGRGEREGRKETGETKGTGIKIFLRETMTVGCAIYRLPNRSICKGKGKGGGKGGERERRKERGEGNEKGNGGRRKGKLRAKGEEKGNGGLETLDLRILA